MRIRSLHFQNAGPLGSKTIEFTDDWNGNVEDLVLFTGPNGCGKSTVLRSIAMLWEAFGHWLDHQTFLSKRNHCRQWLEQWDGVAVIFEYKNGTTQKVTGLVFGEQNWVGQLTDSYGCSDWVGELHNLSGKKVDHKIFINAQNTHEYFSDRRRKMILTFEKPEIPNVIYLDAEERRWVKPKRKVGEHLPESPVLRWLPKYLATDDWQTQLESSLLNLKTTQLQKFHSVIRELNSFLSGKEIDTKVQLGENRLRVKVNGGRGVYHSLDELSAGEHQVLILVYVLSRWAEQGCVVLIDEPDLYLHPSLVNGLLANLEQLVKEKGGQLLITSHSPDVWARYESRGKRVELELV